MKEVNDAARILQSHLGKDVHITKRELETGSRAPDDTDIVTLHLDDISVRSGYTDGDGYVARQELILHGQGTITSEAGNHPLPQKAYEIPLDGSFVLCETATGLDIKTDRALYAITFS